MFTRIRLGLMLLLVTVLVLAGVGWWTWGPRARTGQAGQAPAGARAGEPVDGDEVEAEAWVPGELARQEDWSRPYLPWQPGLALQGPLSDMVRPLTGGVKLLDEELPHGLCRPVILELYMELLEETQMDQGVVRAFEDNPEALEYLQPLFKSSYFKTPEIDLYAPRDEKKKGRKPVSSKSNNPPGKAETSVNMKMLTLCIGLSASACAAVQVREVDTRWLEDCPKEARVAIEALGLGTGEPYDVDLLGIDYDRRSATPLFMKEGPLEARWAGLDLGPDFPHSELGRRMKGAMLFGRAKSYGPRMSVQFDRLKLADGRELPICAIGYDVWGKEPGLERWGPGSHRGVNVGNTEPQSLAALKDLRPGEFPIANSTIWISFGMPFRPQGLSRR
jgi:hypothetical protein